MFNLTRTISKALKADSKARKTHKVKEPVQVFKVLKDWTEYRYSEGSIVIVKENNNEIHCFNK